MNLLAIDAPQAETREAIAPACPYPGLRPFSERESRVFFGRESEIAAITGLLEERQLVVVHGASGCGKSSVVRAGVIPVFRLDAMANSMDARIIIVRPGDPGGPLQALARKLEVEFPRETDEEAADSADLGDGDMPWPTLLAVSPDWAEDIGTIAAEADATLCIVFDQFEEIFAVNRTGSAAEVRRVIDFLISLGEPAPEGTALGKRSLSVIVTMRSDYLGHCAIWDGFAEAVNRCQYLLPRISTVGLIRAIHEPARRAGGSVTNGVADLLMPVISREIDGLPILQHALMRAWHASEDGEVDEAALAAVGGAEHALSRHADETLAAAVGDDLSRAEAADWIFRSLSDLDSDGRIIRRSVSLRQLMAETGADKATICPILDAFRARAASLIMPFPPDPLDENAIVSVSHEALLRQWERVADSQFDRKGRARGLVYREFQDGMIWRSLATQAQSHAQDDTIVLGAAATEQRLPWYRDIEKRPGWIARHSPQGVLGAGSSRDWASVADLMAASDRNLQREKDLVARLRRNQRLVSMFAIGIVVLTVALAILIGVNSTRDAKSEALQERKKALDLQAQRDAARYQIQLDTADGMARKYCAGAATKGSVELLCYERRKRAFLRELARNARAADVLPPQTVPPTATTFSPFIGGFPSSARAPQSGDKK